MSETGGDMLRNGSEEDGRVRGESLVKIDRICVLTNISSKMCIIGTHLTCWGRLRF